MPALLVRYDGGEVTVGEDESVVIGAADDATIKLDHPGVSRHHALLQYDHQRWVLEDAGSTNGTFHEGKRIDRLEVVDAVAIRLGHPIEGDLIELQPASAGQQGSTPNQRTRVSAMAPEAGQAPLQRLVVATWALTAAVLILSIALVLAALID